MNMDKVGILVFFLIQLPTMEYDATFGLVINGLYYVEVISFYTKLIESFEF